MKGRSVVFILTICFLSLRAQDTDPLDRIRFYTLEDLPVEAIFEKTDFAGYYNRTYDPQVFRGQYFAPWRLAADEVENTLRMNGGFDDFFSYDAGDSPCYGGNYQAYSDTFIAEILANLQKSSFPNIQKKAISLKRIDIRQLPTEEFCFKNVRGAGEGYPFDYFQNTTLWAGTPLLVLHQSADRRWYFVVTPYTHGWMLAEGLAWVKPSQVKKIMGGKLAAITREDVALFNDEVSLTGRVGMILPMLNTGVGAGYHLLIPQGGKKQFLRLQPVSVKAGQAAAWPIAFTGENLKKIMPGLFGGKYCWGGIDGGRDCSSTIKDLLTPFGIWLPRNSIDQRQVGRVTELKGTAAEKKQIIVERGVPFLTLLYKRGHAMLYVGTNEEGTPMIFHNVWGLKPVFDDPELAEIAERRTDYGLFGLSKKGDATDEVGTRFIIGKAVLTTVAPEAGFAKEKNMHFDTFLDSMISLNVIVNHE